MPKVSQTYLEERRQQILDAAITCFARKGFRQTTMEDIGQEAGMSYTVPYRYFDNKEEIIVATVQQGVERYVQHFNELQDGDDIPLAIEEMIDEFYLRLEEPGRDVYYRVRVLLWAETLQNLRVAELARSIRNEALRHQVRLIEKGQKLGQINHSLDAWAVANALSAFHDGFVLQWFADPDLNVNHFREAHKAMVRGLFTNSE